MLVSIKLQNNMSCEYICKMLQKAITQYQKDNNTDNTILVIDIKKVSDDTSMVPKIEYKTI